MLCLVSTWVHRIPDRFNGRLAGGHLLRLGGAVCALALAWSCNRLWGGAICSARRWGAVAIWFLIKQKTSFGNLIPRVLPCFFSFDFTPPLTGCYGMMHALPDEDPASHDCRICTLGWWIGFALFFSWKNRQFENPNDEHFWLAALSDIYLRHSTTLHLGYLGFPARAANQTPSISQMIMYGFKLFDLPIRYQIY